MEIGILLIAFGIGLLANIDPCCGSANVLWSSVLAGSPNSRDRRNAIALGLGRAGILASVGAIIGIVGWFVSLPLAVGFLLLAGIFATIGIYELRKAFRSKPNACPVAFDRHGRSPYINAVFLLLPPPLVFVLLTFFDDLSAVPPLDGAVVLGVAGLGLGLPLFVFSANPQIHRTIANRLGGGRTLPVKLLGAFMLLGALLYLVFAFLAVTGAKPPGA